MTHTLTQAQVRRADQLAVQRYGIPSIVLMENAGRGVADVLCGLGLGGPVAICCGKGNNAGDGFVLARHLDLRGHGVRVGLWAAPHELAGDAAVNWQILQRCGVPVEVFGADVDDNRLDRLLADACWVVDALLGTGARGEPRPPLDQLIDRLNAAQIPILAVDLPSGLDADTGRPAQHTIRATVTCTLLAAKPGLLVPQAGPYVGRLHVLDIGTPPRLIDDVLTED